MTARPEPLSEPRRMFKVNLLLASEEKGDWRMACSEWSLIELIYADDDDGPPSQSRWDFTNKCELCGAHLETRNCVIQNTLNGQIRRVGSECVKRFATLHDLDGGLDVGRYVDTWTKEQEQANAIRALVRALMARTIDREAIYQFHKVVTATFGSIATLADWQRHGPRLLDIAQVAQGSWLAERVQSVLLNPLSVPMTAPTRKRPRSESEEELRLKYGWRKPSKQKMGRATLISGRSGLYQENRLDPFKRD